MHSDKITVITCHFVEWQKLSWEDLRLPGNEPQPVPFIVDYHINLHRCSVDYIRTYLDLEIPGVSGHSEWNDEICGNLSSANVVGLRLEMPLQPPSEPSGGRRRAAVHQARPLYSSSPYAILELHTGHHPGRHRPSLGHGLDRTSYAGFRGMFSFLPQGEFED